MLTTTSMHSVSDTPLPLRKMMTEATNVFGMDTNEHVDQVGGNSMRAGKACRMVLALVFQPPQPLDLMKFSPSSRPCLFNLKPDVVFVPAVVSLNELTRTPIIRSGPRSQPWNCCFSYPSETDHQVSIHVEKKRACSKSRMSWFWSSTRTIVRSD